MFLFSVDYELNSFRISLLGGFGPRARLVAIKQDQFWHVGVIHHTVRTGEGFPCFFLQIVPHILAMMHSALICVRSKTISGVRYKQEVQMLLQEYIMTDSLQKTMRNCVELQSD